MGVDAGQLREGEQVGVHRESGVCPNLSARASYLCPTPRRQVRQHSHRVFSAVTTREQDAHRRLGCGSWSPVRTVVDAFTGTMEIHSLHVIKLFA